MHLQFSNLFRGNVLFSSLQGFISCIVLGLVLWVQTTVQAQSGSSQGMAHTNVLYSRQYRVSPERIMEGLQAFVPEQTFSNRAESGKALKSYFEAAGVFFPTNTPPAESKMLIYNHANGVLLVRANLKELDLIESALEALNATPPQVSIQTKIIQLDASDDKPVGFDWVLGNLQQNNPASSPTNQGVFLEGTPKAFNYLGSSPVPAEQGVPSVGTLSGIMNDDQYRLVLRALENRKNATMLSAPTVTTLSGRTAVVSITDSATEAGEKPGFPETGITFEAKPTVAADGYTIQMEATVSMVEKIAPDASGTEARIRKTKVSSALLVWDGQTAVMQGMASSSGAEDRKSLLILITPIIVDPAGKRIHSPANLPYDPNQVPPQKQLRK